MVWNTTSVLASRPTPVKVTVCRGWAAAWPATAGVPLPALAVMLERLRPKAALVPPRVLMRIGPAGTLSGTCRFSPPLVTERFSVASKRV